LRLRCSTFAQMPSSRNECLAMKVRRTRPRPDPIIKSAILGLGASFAVAISIPAHSLAVSDACVLASVSWGGGCPPALWVTPQNSTSPQSDSNALLFIGGIRSSRNIADPVSGFGNSSALGAATADLTNGLGGLTGLDELISGTVQADVRADLASAPLGSSARGSGISFPTVTVGGQDNVPVSRFREVAANVPTAAPAGVPESASLGLLSVGLAGLVFACRYKKSGWRSCSAAERPERK
jgi:hypothetical protein